MTRFHESALGVTLALATAGAVMGEPTSPVAIRWWGHSCFTIENAWDLRVAIDPFTLIVGYEQPDDVGIDVLLVSHIHPDHANGEFFTQPWVPIPGVHLNGWFLPEDRVLDRAVNEDEPTVEPWEADATYPSHAIRIRNVSSFHDETEGEENGLNALFIIETEGVRILHLGDIGQPVLTDTQLQEIGKVDVLMVPVGGTWTVDGEQAAALTEQIGPRFVLPMHYKSDGTTHVNLIEKLDTAEPFLEALPERYERVDAIGNTLAVGRATSSEPERPKVVILKWKPWTMPPDLAALFDAKDEACRTAEDVFDDLSVTQLNHKPSDGTHTPRWNAEHMMGRELGFMSAVFTGRDPTFARIDLNPEQMPPDYTPAHPDWNGAEESRQLARARNYSRRFAYLLDGVDLDQKLEGSPWSLRGLLEQLTTHYEHHTANVEKKFALPDWPVAPAPPSKPTPAEGAAPEPATTAPGG